MRLPRVRTMLAWGARFLLIGFCIGLIMPFFLGGEASFMFRVSPVLGALLGVVFGVVGGLIRDLVSPPEKAKTGMPEL